jgi:hypothetical protein
VSDLLATYGISAFVALVVAVLMTVPPGAAPRYMQARRYHRSGSARHARTGAETTPLSALETMPDPVVSPFAARTA